MLPPLPREAQSDVGGLSSTVRCPTAGTNSGATEKTNMANEHFYPEIEPYPEGRLRVDGLHTLYRARSAARRTAFQFCSSTVAPEPAAAPPTDASSIPIDSGSSPSTSEAAVGPNRQGSLRTTPRPTSWPTSRSCERNWPELDATIVPDAGHSSHELGITRELVAATARIAETGSPLR